MAALLVLAVAACSRGADSQTLAGTLPVVQAHAAMEAAAAPLAEAVTVAAAPVSPPAVPRLVVSELMVDPLLLDDSTAEYIEIVNLSPGPVRLADLSLTFPSGRAFVPERPHAPVLLPGAIVIMTPHGEGAGEARLRGLRLPNQAGRLELSWRKHVVDVVHWYRKRPWPKAKPGVALERVSPMADGQHGNAWRSSRDALRVMERGSPGKVAWVCGQVRGTSLEGRCLADPPGPKTPNRARKCSVRKESLGGDLNPRPSDYESLALTS